MAGLPDLMKTLDELHELQRTSWSREAQAEDAVIAQFEAELAAATEEARAERERRRAELHAARARFVADWRDRWRRSSRRVVHIGR